MNDQNTSGMSILERARHRALQAQSSVGTASSTTTLGTVGSSNNNDGNKLTQLQKLTQLNQSNAVTSNLSGKPTKLQSVLYNQHL